MPRENTARDGTDQRRRRLLATLGAGTAGAVAGCLGNGDDDDDVGDDADDGDDEDRDFDTLRVGAYGPLTGPVANIGEAKQTGWDVVAELVNEDGGVAGAEIELFYADSESEPGRGRSAVSRLIQEENIDILGGGYHSDVTLSVIELADENDMPFVIDESVSGAINEAIVEQNMETVFKTAPPSEAYGAAWGDLVEDFDEQGVGYFPFEDKTIAMIAEDTSYGISVMDETARQVEEAGWEVISEDEVPLDETDFSPILSRIRAEEPDIVWAVQTNSAGTGALAEQFAEFDFGEAHFFHNFGLTADEAIERAGPAGNGAFTIVHPAAVPELLGELGWDEAWEASTDLGMSGFAATSMTNIGVISELVESAGGVEALNDMSRAEWEEHVIDHEPITGGIGTIDFQENHQAAWGSPETIPSIGYQVVDGSLNFVWPFELAEFDVDESFYG